MYLRVLLSASLITQEDDTHQIIKNLDHSHSICVHVLVYVLVRLHLNNHSLTVKKWYAMNSQELR